jgi:hypothetical protein
MFAVQSPSLVPPPLFPEKGRKVARVRLEIKVRVEGQI